ncbi:MAG: UDP-N-acetylmuramoyl-L-alanine--D-glutamate ligase [Candidatus Daviesbacteria bacterium]|nr:UDP-N-acetylmuramoyl-L-alanine--D-glutamate ligase [Candidatus Daviesbacteria bacterium]
MDTNFAGKKVLISERSEESRFRGKRVLILGLGINQGGLGATRFFAKLGAKVKVTDLKDKEFLKPSLDQLKEFPEIEYVLGEHKFEDLDWADLIIRNPALKPDNPYLKYAREKGKQVEMDMGIFLQFVKPEQVIGVTGTKGKSTTASLIYETLKAGGKDIIFAGNIGKSVLDTIPYVKTNTLVVLEISSFQLMAFGEHHVSPHWAVISNIYPDHLNYHGTMENYTEAKRFIAKFQNNNDFLFIKKGDIITNSDNFIKGLKGKIIYYSLTDLPENFLPKIPGEHNLENFAASFAVFNEILRTQGDAQRAYQALENFAGVEFRLQLIYDKNGIKIYNDTAATTPVAAQANIKSLSGAILITGGVNKDLPYNDLAQAIEKYAKSVYFLEGSATDEIKKCLQQIASSKTPRNDVIAIRQKQEKQSLLIQGTYSDLEKLLTDVKSVTKPGDTILFSPGAASFNLFQNEFDRGRKFNLAVAKIFG